MKSVIVTGASGNMGQAVIRKFLAEGFHVTGALIPNDPVKPDISHPAFEAAAVNLMDEEEAGKMVQAAADKHGSIDAAVLTVGGFAMGNIAATTSADILNQYRLNFETAYHVARPVFTQMMRQGSGRIFLVGSRPGQDMKNGKGMVAYGLAKSLIFRLAELLNEESKGTNVVSSVIVPSTIDTPQNRAAMPEADFTKWVTPEAIAEVIYFYCSGPGAVLREPVIKAYGNS